MCAYIPKPGEVVALHSNGSTKELRIPELRSSWQGTREQVVASGSIPRRGTRHQNIESGSPSHLSSVLLFPQDVPSGWLWWCVTSPYMWTVCGFPLSSQSTKRVAALGCSSYGFGKHNSLHLQNSTMVTLYTCSHVTPCSHTM